MISVGKVSVSSSGRMRSFSFSARVAAKSSKRDFKFRLLSCALASPVFCAASPGGRRNSWAAWEKPRILEFGAWEELVLSMLLVAWFRAATWLADWLGVTEGSGVAAAALLTVATSSSMFRVKDSSVSEGSSTSGTVAGSGCSGCGRGGCDCGDCDCGGGVGSRNGSVPVREAVSECGMYRTW